MQDYFTTFPRKCHHTKSRACLKDGARRPRGKAALAPFCDIGYTHSDKRRRIRMLQIKFIKLREGAHIPQKAHEDDAGFDLYASEDCLLKAHGFGCVPTAIAISTRATGARSRSSSSTTARRILRSAPGCASHRWSSALCCPRFLQRSRRLTKRSAARAASALPGRNKRTNKKSAFGSFRKRFPFYGVDKA